MRHRSYDRLKRRRRTPALGIVTRPLGGPLAHVSALMAAAGDAAAPDSFARSLDDADAVSRENMNGWEAYLAGLDDAAWQAMNVAAVERLRRAPKRGWDQLFDLLNEAKAYAALKTLGCTEISFVTRTTARKSPDLWATWNGQMVLCEVKTIEVRHTPVPEDFFTGKLAWTIAEAKAQLDAFGTDDARKIVCLVFQRAGDVAWPAALTDRIKVQGASAGVELMVL